MVLCYFHIWMSEPITDVKVSLWNVHQLVFHGIWECRSMAVSHIID